MSLKGGGKMYNKNEIWKDICFIENNIIYNYKGLYKVSNIGRIKSLIDNRGNRRDKILKVIKDKDGYLMVNLYKNKKGKRLKVHRLVAHMFVDGYFDGAEVDHINTIRDDNRVENLRFVTREENINNRLTKKHMSEATKGENNPMYGKRGKDNPNLGKKRTEEFKQARRGESHPNAKEIYCLELDKKFTTIKQASEEFGLDDSAIVKCCKGKQKTCGGYHWMYYEDWLKIDNK